MNNQIKIRGIKMVFILLLSGIQMMAQPDIAPLTEAEQMPYFTGCDQHKNEAEKRTCSNNSLVAFISSNLTYPETARSENIQGTVYVSFVIDENGKVDQSSVLKGIGGGCDEEALSVVREMPNWVPGYHQGKPVKVKLNLPIQFNLSDTKTDKSTNYEINWGSLTGKKVSPSQLQDNVSKKLIVRDQDGNELHFSELIFTFEKRATYLEASSNGSVNSKMRKLIKKTKPGGTFKITAVIQKKEDYIEVEKVFEVIK